MSKWLGSLDPRWLGTVSALTIALLVNLFGVRFDRRWDFTSDRRYTPAPTLQRLLEELRQDVTIVVLLGRTDPLAPTVEQLLTSYRQITRHLLVDWIDPDRDPARFLAKQAELGVTAGHTEDGRIASNAVLVVTARGRRYFVEAEELVGPDPDATESTSHFERALAVALRTLFDATTPTVCFTEGHRELSLSDRSPQGLSTVKERLEHDAMVVKTVDLANGDRQGLEGCRLVVVAAPDVPLTPDAIQRLTRATNQSSLLLLGGVVPNSSGRLLSVGFEPLAKLGGITLATDVVVELDEAYRLPGLFGETFFATPREHPSTRALLRGNGNSPLRVVVALARSLHREPGSPALPLLESSPRSASLTDISTRALDAVAQNSRETRSHVVAMAGPILGASPSNRIAIAPASILSNRTFESPSLLVTQAFAKSLTSWLLATEASAVEIAPRPIRSIGLELSAEDFGQIARYVVLVMPGCALLAGAGLMLLRRRQRPDTPTRSGSSVS